MKKYLLAAVVIGLVAAGAMITGCSNSASSDPAPTPTPPKTYTIETIELTYEAGTNLEAIQTAIGTVAAAVAGEEVTINWTEGSSPYTGTLSKSLTIVEGTQATLIAALNAELSETATASLTEIDGTVLKLAAEDVAE